MTRLLDPGTGDAITLDELVEALETTPFDPHDEDSFAALGPLLARLGRNRLFLADLAIAELKTRCAGQSAANGYGAQVFLLRPPNGRFVLRANFWPSGDDGIVQASGTAPFVYGMAHDHNFPFLTYGYLGPGYWSDYWERDPERPDQPMRFTGRRRIEPGELLLYRMCRDVHSQLPPDAFSVTLNILGSHPSHRWIDQHRFDPTTGGIAEVLTSAPSEGLATIAAHLGGGNGLDLIDHLARRHPHPRMRATALAALASARPDAPETRALIERTAPAYARMDPSAADSPLPDRAKAPCGPGDSVRSRDTAA